MARGFIASEIRRTDGVLLRRGLSLGLLLALLWAGDTVYWADFFQGPTKIDSGVLAGLASHEAGPKWIEVDVEQGIPFGVQRLEVPLLAREETGVPTAEVRAFPVGHRLLLALVPLDFEDTRLQGFVATVPSEVQERKPIFHRQHPRLTGSFFPLYLNAVENFRREGWIVLAAASVLALAMLSSCAAWMGRKLRPSRHPILEALRRYGPPEVIRAEIAGAIAAESLRFGTLFRRTASCLVTRGWLFFRTRFELDMLRFEELAWVHLQVEKGRLDLPRPGRKWVVVFHTLNHRKLSVPLPKRKAKALLGEVVSRAPWAIAGTSDRLANLWRASPDLLFQEVEQRKEGL